MPPGAFPKQTHTTSVAQLRVCYTYDMQVGASFLVLVSVAAVSVTTGLAVSLTILRARITANFEKRLQDSKDQFVGLASHYLLTPITIIQTATNRLQEADATLDTAGRQKLYEAIMAGQQRLWIIAEQLVLINEVDGNHLQLKIEVTDLADVVSSAVAAVDVFARAKKLQIRIENQLQEISQARVDARRLKQAVIALMDNAIKFSMEDTVITVRLWLQDGYFMVQVEDEGIGMPEEVIQHLTEKFYRGSSIYSFDYEGLGLGLHIAYAIITMHTGTMVFQSRPKRGTVVTIELPSL